MDNSSPTLDPQSACRSVCPSSGPSPDLCGCGHGASGQSSDTENELDKSLLHCPLGTASWAEAPSAPRPTPRQSPPSSWSLESIHALSQTVAYYPMGEVRGEGREAEALEWDSRRSVLRFESRTRLVETFEPDLD